MTTVELNSKQAARLAGVSYRMLDHWIHRGVIAPMKNTTGTGDPRRFDFADLLRLRVVARLRAEGVSLQQIRQAIVAIEDRWQLVDPLLSGALLSIDGEVYLAESPAELWHVLSGQGAVKSFLLVDVGEIARDTKERVRKLQLAA